MNKFSIVIVVLFAVLISSTANAQLFSLGVGGGLTNVVGSKDYTDDISKEGLGYSTEWNGGIIAKLGLPLVPITPRAFILYHSLGGSENFTEPLEKGSTINSTEVKTSQPILSVGLGVQYGFIPIPAGIDPYLAFDLMYNNFGEFKLTNFGNEIKSDGVSRFGLGLGVGAEVSIIPVVNLDILVSYQMMNLVGKDEGEPSLSTLTLDAFILFSFL